MTRHAWLTSHAARKSRRAFVTLLFVTFSTVSGSRARAADLIEQAHSLRTVPADVAFYSASFRLKEQLDIFRASNTYNRIMQIPVVQMAKLQAQFQWEQSQEPAIARFREYFNSAEGQEVVAELKEMFSEEIFVYGDKNVGQTLQLFMELNNLNRTSKLEALASGENDQEVLARNVMEVLNQHAEQFVVPDIIWGFRIKDAPRATKHLDRIQEVLAGLLNEKQPELAEHIKREQIAGNEFLTVRLDGSMIPWDRLRDEAEDMTDEQFAKWQELLNKKTLALAVGVVGEFVLMSIGDTTDHLTKLGEGESLATQPLMTRLAKHAGQRVTSIAYASAAFTKSMNSPQQTIDELITATEEGLQGLEVDDGLKSKLIEDLKGLGDDVVKYLPEPGDLAAVSYLTSRGYESFQYQTGTRPFQDSAEPLSVLEHAGGKPMLLVANRTKQSLEDYDQTVSWLKRVAAQVELIAKEKSSEEDWAKYMEMREKALPLLERWNNATREHMFPALADGQQAFVMDASAKSQQWFEKMPKSPQPLPIPEFGMVANVSDADQLRQGVAEYFKVIQEAVSALHELNPDSVPDYQLPQPETRELADGGTIYTYPLPAEWGVDSQFTPNAALTKTAAAVTITPTLTERLLRTMPLEIDTSLDLRHPAASVSYIEFARMIDMVKPWVTYGGGIAMGQIKLEDDGESDEPEEQSPEQAKIMMTAGLVLPQIDQFLDVAAALRTASSITYHEDGAWVTHGEVHLQDLK